MNDPHELSLNGDLTKRVIVHTNEMPWAPSPSPGVDRKRLHLVGTAEAGQVTSVVRYAAGSRFPAHDHPEGEEILVLEGTFSDEHGDWHAGTYLLNPEGFRHAPFSAAGCTIFVKLRQYAGNGRFHACLDTNTMTWKASEEPGVSRKALYEDAAFSDTAHLERWAPDVEVGPRTYPGGAEIFVLDGRVETGGDTLVRGSWLRLPAGSVLEGRTSSGAEIFVRRGALALLRSSPS